MARTTPSPPPADDATSERADGSANDVGAGANANASAHHAPVESEFFAWIRRLELGRRPGWLGGVCAGVAHRIGIDPLIVRGVVVVLGLLAVPVALLYAIAWFLLPDEHGTIHAQQLGRGVVSRALPGIVVVFLASFLPLTQLAWSAGSLYWGDLGWPGAVIRIFWTGLLVAGAVVAVVLLARRAASDVPVAPSPTTTDDRPGTVPTFPAGSTPDAEGRVPEATAAASAAATASALPAAEGAAAFTATSTAGDPGEPPAPPADASAEELAAWKQSQDEWQRQRAAWAADQKRSDHERRQAEARERAVAVAEAARERARIRKLTRPRANAGVVFLVLGVGLVAGALSAYAAAGAPGTRGAEWMIGAAVLTLVLGVGTVVVGLARRRSGALAFFSTLAVLALAFAVALPADRTIIPPNSWIDSSRDGRYAQLAGTTSIYVPDGDERATVDLWQLSGSVHVELHEGATVRLQLTTDDRDGRSDNWVSVDERDYDDAHRFAQYRVTDGRLTVDAGDGEPDLVLRVWAGTSTSVRIVTWTEAEPSLTLSPRPDEWIESIPGEEPVDLLDPTPTPIPTPDPSAPTGEPEGANR